MELIEWKTRIGNLESLPMYNYIGQQDYHSKFCPRCFNVVKCKVEFQQISDTYGWKIIDTTHNCN